MRFLAALVAFLTIGFVAVPASASTLAWASCGDDGAVQCTSVPVPVDHTDPGGSRIDITITRWPAADPAARRGTLVVHAGGPAPSVLTVDGMAHSLYLAGQPCVRDAVHRYLLDGALPDDMLPESTRPGPGAQCPV